MKNLKFINTLTQVHSIILSFVIQKDNYKEIVSFYRLMKDIFKNQKNIIIQYYKILNWGVLSEEEFKDKAIWDKNHPHFNELVDQIKILDSFNDNKVIHSLHGI